jgi:hypothetical protein
MSDTMGRRRNRDEASGDEAMSPIGGGAGEISSFLSDVERLYR